ncbi:MAG TPA: hypothetical protein VI589_03685 [Vicinamibacteria bacterium]
MQALEFWKTVTLDRTDVLEDVLRGLAEGEVKYCVIGGQGVNAYADPVVSLDLDLVVATRDLDRVERLFAPSFKVERFPHSLNLSRVGSDLRVQFQRDPRYEAFLEHAREEEVLGLRLPVARIEDVLQGKVWAALDSSRRPSKRQKDLADIARLIEVRPELRASVPREILDRLI